MWQFLSISAACASCVALVIITLHIFNGPRALAIVSRWCDSQLFTVVEVKCLSSSLSRSLAADGHKANILAANPLHGLALGLVLGLVHRLVYRLVELTVYDHQRHRERVAVIKVNVFSRTGKISDCAQQWTDEAIPYTKSKRQNISRNYGRALFLREEKLAES